MECWLLFHARYSIRLYINEEWRYIIVDDYIPVENGKAIVSHSSDVNEIHTMILEKAIAKLYGSYMNLTSYDHRMEEGLLLLTSGLTTSLYVYV